MEKKISIGRTNDKKIINVVKQLNLTELVCLSSTLLSIAEEISNNPKTFLPQGFMSEAVWHKNWTSIHEKLQEQYNN